MSSVNRVQEYLTQRGVTIQIVELDKSTRTAQLAADAIGTELGSIVKSLIFVAGDQTVLALVAGDQRADLQRISQVLGAASVRIATADEVREKTGFAIGGVPPLGHSAPMPTLIDRSLGRFATVYAAAGSPRAIFPISFQTLVELTAGQLSDITE
jgi:prolyl-tRNA editing enzyme YbaK/EbsC (Cys-tRNA(Pro) deacylase)